VTSKDSNIEVHEEEEEYDVDMSNEPSSEGEGNDVNEYGNCLVNNDFDKAKQDDDAIFEGSEEDEEEMREGIT
jgi:hypothetical protein